MSFVWPFTVKSPDQYRRIDQGWDLQADVGTPILAVDDGTMTHACDPAGFGCPYPVLVLDHPTGDGLAVYYGHNHPEVGDDVHVHQGDVIAHALAQPGGNAAGLPGWLEIGWWVNGPTGDGQAMHDALIDAPVFAGVPSPAPPPGGGPGGGASGPFDLEGLIDRLIRDTISHIPVVGGQLARGLHDVLHPVLHAADDALNGIWSFANVVWDKAQAVGQEVLHDAEHLFNLGKQYALDIVHDAERALTSLIQDVERLGADALHDTERRLTGLINLGKQYALDIVHDAERGLTRLIQDVERLGADALHVAQVGLRDAIHGVEVGLRDTIHGVEVGLRDAIHGVEVGLRDTIHGVEVGFHDALHLVDVAWRDALHVLKVDVVDPLVRDLRHWNGDLWDDILSSWPVIKKAWRWIELAAETSFDVVTDLPDEIRAVTLKDVADAYDRQHGHAA